MADVAQRFRRPPYSWWLVPLGLAVAAAVNLLSGSDGAPVSGPGSVAFQIATVLVLLQWVIFRRPVWIDPTMREIRWSTLFGLNFGVWRFDEVTSARLSESWFRSPFRDTVVLRVGWVRLSFEVPLGTGYDIIKMLDAGPWAVGSELSLAVVPGRREVGVCVGMNSLWLM